GQGRDPLAQTITKRPGRLSPCADVCIAEEADIASQFDPWPIKEAHDRTTLPKQTSISCGDAIEKSRSGIHQCRTGPIAPVVLLTRWGHLWTCAAQYVMHRTWLCRYEADIGSSFLARLAVPSYPVAIGFGETSQEPGSIKQLLKRAVHRHTRRP